jgi:predicted DNA-binding transcriptional regulator YafY
MNTTKNRLLAILDILNRESDEENPISAVEINTHLNAIGLNADRKTIYRDIEDLREHGIVIEQIRKRQNQYYIKNRPFELSELILLVDAVQAAKFVSVRESQAIIRKLSSFISVHQSEHLKRRLYVEKQVKSANEKVLSTAGLLHVAANRKLKVAFRYIEYTPEKKKSYRRNGQVYSFSPYALTWNNDCYYALGYSDCHKKIVTFRVDRIHGVELTKRRAEPAPKGFKADKYAKSAFLMLDGDVQTVTLRCKNELMNSIVDRFGEKVNTVIADNEHFTAEVEVAVSNTFFGWIVGFGGRIEITAPENVKTQYFDTLCRIVGKPH